MRMRAWRTPLSVERGYRTLHLATEQLSFCVPLRLVIVCVCMAAIALVAGVVSLFFGDFPVGPQDVLGALTGVADDFTSRVILQWRVPVALAAVMFGAILGLGGAIFQSLTRNPLGSPDVIGFDAGAYTAVVTTVLIFGVHTYWTVAGMALVGGLLTALLVYILAYRQGTQGFRLIIVGIGVSAMLGSFNAYMVTRADVSDAMLVGFWAAGSISRVSWASMGPSLIVALVIVLGVAALASSLRTMELGEDSAANLGVPVSRHRLGLLVLGVATSALVTAAAGPIGFIALIAPQLAKRITRSAGVTLLGAACMGSVLLVAAHLASLIVSVMYRPIPVGLITMSAGGLYLIWLLYHEARQPQGGTS